MVTRVLCLGVLLGLTPSTLEASELWSLEECRETAPLWGTSKASWLCDERGPSRKRYCLPPVENMIGDGGLLQPRVIVAGSRIFNMQNHVSKVSENNSALPQDRIGLNFSTMQNVSLGRRIVGVPPVGQAVVDDLQEYSLFAERTLLQGLVSVDLTVPIYRTSEFEINNNAEFLVGPQVQGEMGDLAFGIKGLLHRSSSLATSLGLRVEVPTRGEVRVDFTDTHLHDDVWHFTPYLATQWTPTQNLFFNGFASYRLNSTDMRATAAAGTYAIREPTYLMIDGSAGYWFVRRPHGSGLTGLAALLELHYTTTPESEAALALQGIPTTGAALGHTDYLNLTAGLTSRWNERVSLTGAVSAPLRSNSINTNNSVLGPTDRSYDWAFLLNLNFYL